MAKLSNGHYTVTSNPGPPMVASGQGGPRGRNLVANWKSKSSPISSSLDFWYDHILFFSSGTGRPRPWATHPRLRFGVSVPLITDGGVGGWGEEDGLGCRAQGYSWIKSFGNATTKDIAFCLPLSTRCILGRWSDAKTKFYAARSRNFWPKEGYHILEPCIGWEEFFSEHFLNYFNFYLANINLLKTSGGGGAFEIGNDGLPPDAGRRRDGVPGEGNLCPSLFNFNFFFIEFHN